MSHLFDFTLCESHISVKQKLTLFHERLLCFACISFIESNYFGAYKPENNKPDKRQVGSFNEVVKIELASLVKLRKVVAKLSQF